MPLFKLALMTLLALLLGFTPAAEASRSPGRAPGDAPTAILGGAENGRIAFNEVFFHRRSVAIFTAKADGTEIRPITHGRPGIITAVPDWSPDGHWIALQKGKWDANRFHVVVMRTNGTHRTNLTRGACPPDSCSGEGLPVWSRDGHRIAFHRFNAGGIPSIYVMRSDGTGRRRLTQGSGEGDWYPSLSPSGSRVVFESFSNRTGSVALFTVRVNGTDLERITPWRTHAGHPDWSPDGRWIAFENHTSDGKTSQMCVIHPDGSGFHRITSGHDIAWSRPSFSPDGTMITALGVPGEASENDIFVMNLDGSGISVVTASLSLHRSEGVPDWGPRR